MKSNRGVVLALFLLALSVQAQQEDVVWEKRIDWQQGILTLEAQIATDPITPKVRYKAEKQIAGMLPVFFMQAILEIHLDSYTTIGDRLKSEQNLYGQLQAMAAAVGSKKFAYLSERMDRVHVRYQFPFYGQGGLASPFILHRQPFPIEDSLHFEPTRTFTGLVIYAKGEYPAHGKSGLERIQPCFFPKLYDQDMNLVLSAEMVDPERLRSWGMAAYTSALDEKTFFSRVGYLPLKTMARGVFGKNSGDILLPNETVRKLLVNEANRKLLQEGRILIILD